MMGKTTCTFMLLWVWCLCLTTNTLAFLLVVRHRHRLASSSSILGTLGNQDFTKIFGKQEAAERRTRDLAREYHPPPKIIHDSDSKEDESSSGKNKQQEEKSIANKGSQEFDAKKIKTDKVIRKYVPPPNL